MAQLQQLTNLLLAAADAPDPEGDGLHCLFTNERSSLISKLLNGTEYGQKELIIDSIRPDSSATYILSSNIRIIFCVSADSSFRAIKYYDDDDEWLDIEGLPHYEVHPEGHVAGFIGQDSRTYGLFQDPSGDMVSLNETWASNVLPVDAAVGTPIGTTYVGTQLFVIYLGKDRHLHVIKQSNDGRFGEDIIFASCVFEGKLKKISASCDEESQKLEAYVLTEKRGIFLVKQEAEEKKSLGKVGEDGVFVPGTDAENTVTVNLNLLNCSPFGATGDHNTTTCTIM